MIEQQFLVFMVHGFSLFSEKGHTVHVTNAYCINFSNVINLKEHSDTRKYSKCSILDQQKHLNTIRIEDI